MSEYSHANERRFVRIGFPFCRGETRMEELVDLEAIAWGVGCTILGPEEVVAGGARSSR